MTKKVEKIWIYQGFICLLVLGIYGYGVSHIWGMCMYPDEFGYWSTAAKMAGWDWSQISSLGSYYSFGYSIILYPILIFTSDSIAAYRVAVLVNAILMCVASFLLQKIVTKLFPERSRLYGIFLSGISVLYPSWIFYMQTTMTEALLSFMVILVAYLFLKLLERPKAINVLLLSLAVGYTYTLHMRTVGLVIACILTVLIWGILEKKIRKNTVIVVLCLAAVLVLAYLGKEAVQDTIYAGSEVLDINDYGGQVSKIKVLFSLEGMKNVILLTAGKIVYLGLASGGLFLWGIWWSVKNALQMVSKVKEKETPDTMHMLSLYLTLLFLGTLGINCIYTIHSVSLDNLLYGRYIEFIVPLYVLLGGCCLKEELRKKINLGKVILPYGISYLLLILGLWKVESGRVRGAHSAVLNVFTAGEEINPLIFVVKMGALGLVCLLVTSLMLWYINEKKGKEFFLSILIGINLSIGIANSYPIVYTSSENIRMDLTLIDLMEERIEEGDKVFFLVEGENQWIAFLQMQLREKKIEALKPENINEIEEENTILFAYWNSEYLEKLEEKYDRSVMGDLYYLYYN